MTHEVTELRDLAEHYRRRAKETGISGFAAALTEAAEHLEEIVADRSSCY